MFVVTEWFTFNGCGNSSAVIDKKNIESDEYQALYIEPKEYSKIISK